MRPLDGTVNSALESLKISHVSSITDMCVPILETPVTDPGFIMNAVYLLGVVLIIVAAWHIIFRGSISDTMESIRLFFGRWKRKHKE